MNQEVYLSIIFPAYNEAKRIAETLKKSRDFIGKQDFASEVIIVDDGSRDSTAAITRELTSSWHKFRLISNPHLGKAFAVKKGVQEARGKYVLFSDVDLSTPLPEVQKLLKVVASGEADIAIGSREGAAAQRIREPTSRHLLGRGFNLLVRTILPMRSYQDTQCGFKLFQTQAAREIFSRLVVYGDGAQEIRGAYTGAFDVKVLLLAEILGFSTVEVPIIWKFQKTENVSITKDPLLMLRDILKMRGHYLLGDYSDRV